MKRIMTWILAAIMVAGLLSGCAKEEVAAPGEQLAQVPAMTLSAEAMAVEAAIDQIGTVSMQSRAVIDSARVMYEACAPEIQAEIRNLDTLEAAEEDYQIGKSFFDLDRMPNRYETAFMLVRMLGKEEEAVSGSWDMPFTDVEGWAKPYVGYVYANGLMEGTSDTAFDGTATLTAPEYMTCILGALGYHSGEDFTPETIWELSDALTLTKGQYTADATEFAPGDLEKIYLKACEVRYVISNATAWGLPADIRWIACPKTIAELDNNMLFACMLGNYSLNFKNFAETGIHSGIVYQRYDTLCTLYPELIGIFRSDRKDIHIDPDGVLRMSLKATPFTNEEIYAQQLAALAVAKEIKAELHTQGKVKPGMTQLEIAQVYYDYLQGLRTSPGEGGPGLEETGIGLKYNSPYAILINRQGDCVGRAATYNLLMNLEGITAWGVDGHVIGTGPNEGHEISGVLLDGVIYYCDWFPMNGKAMATNIDDWFTFRTGETGK